MQYKIVNGEIVNELGQIVNLDNKKEVSRKLRGNALYNEVKKRLKDGQKAGDIARYFRVSDSMISRIKHDKTTYEPRTSTFKKGNQNARKFSEEVYKQIVTLRKTKGLGYLKIARITGVSSSQVKQILIKKGVVKK